MIWHIEPAEYTHGGITLSYTASNWEFVDPDWRAAKEMALAHCRAQDAGDAVASGVDQPVCADGGKFPLCNLIVQKVHFRCLD